MESAKPSLIIDVLQLDLAYHQLTREKLSDAFFYIHKELLNRRSTEIVLHDNGAVSVFQYSHKPYSTPYKERDVDLLRVLGDLHNELLPETKITSDRTTDPAG